MRLEIKCSKHAFIHRWKSFPLKPGANVPPTNNAIPGTTAAALRGGTGEIKMLFHYSDALNCKQLLLSMKHQPHNSAQA